MLTQRDDPRAARALTAGLGCRRGCSADELQAILARALATAGVELAALAQLAAPDFKRDEGGVRDLARRLSRPVRWVPPDALRAQAGAVRSRSALSLARYGVGSVAEACALAGAAQVAPAGTRATLRARRVLSEAASCALGEARRCAP